MSTPIFDTAPEERDVVLAVDHRTKPLYPTDGPGDGRSWRQFFDDLRAPYREKDEDEEEPQVEVIEPGHDLAEPQKAPGAVGTLARRLAGQGWEVRARASVVRVPAVRYASDSDEDAKVPYSKGDVRFAEHLREAFCLLGVKRTLAGKPAMAVQATWTRKEGGSLVFQGATTRDPVLGEAWRSTVTKERKQRAWEAEEGVAAPWGLGQWLDAVCPKPEVKKRTKKEAA